MEANQRPHDAAMFNPSKLRIDKYAYPAAWTPLRDIALARSPAASASLAGRQVSPALLTQCFTGVERVWLVTRRKVWRKVLHSRLTQTELKLVGTMYLIGHWRVRSTVLRLFQARHLTGEQPPHAAHANAYVLCGRSREPAGK